MRNLSDTTTSDSGPSVDKQELERKRARDRRSQQAMRDRNKSTIDNLHQQVQTLTAALDQQSTIASQLGQRLNILEDENTQLRAYGATASTLTSPAVADSPFVTSPCSSISVPAQLGPRQHHEKIVPLDTAVQPLFYSDFLLSAKYHEPWGLPPFDIPHTCLADEIVQTVIAKEREKLQATLLHASTPTTTVAGTKTKQTALKPDPAALLYADHKTDDEISNMVGGIVRSYKEIETLPKQVAVFYCMSILFKWLIALDVRTWDSLPAWLRPLPCQLQIPHAGWIDRIPWPRARQYLIRHPEISLDVFAASYSSCISVLWDHDDDHVLIRVGGVSQVEGSSQTVVINPIFEQHIRQLKSWTVDEPFRLRFKELAGLIDEDRRDWDER